MIVLLVSLLLVLAVSQSDVIDLTFYGQTFSTSCDVSVGSRSQWLPFHANSKFIASARACILLNGPVFGCNHNSSPILDIELSIKNDDGFSATIHRSMSRKDIDEHYRVCSDFTARDFAKELKGQSLRGLKVRVLIEVGFVGDYRESDGDRTCRASLTQMGGVYHSAGPVILKDGDKDEVYTVACDFPDCELGPKHNVIGEYHFNPSEGKAPVHESDPAQFNDGTVTVFDIKCDPLCPKDLMIEEKPRVVYGEETILYCGAPTSSQTHFLRMNPNPRYLSSFRFCILYSDRVFECNPNFSPLMEIRLRMRNELGFNRTVRKLMTIGDVDANNQVCVNYSACDLAKQAMGQSLQGLEVSAEIVAGYMGLPGDSDGNRTYRTSLKQMERVYHSVGPVILKDGDKDEVYSVVCDVPDCEFGPKDNVIGEYHFNPSEGKAPVCESDPAQFNDGTVTVFDIKCDPRCPKNLMIAQKRTTAS